MYVRSNLFSCKHDKFINFHTLVLSSFLLINKYRFLVFRQLINFLRIFR